jgi:hypothetical protein
MNNSLLYFTQAVLCSSDRTKVYLSDKEHCTWKLIFKGQMVLYVASALMFDDTAFWSQCIFMGTVLFSQQTAIISSNSIKQLTFVMSKCFVFLCGTYCVFKYYLHKPQLQGVNNVCKK